jgi:hypothetical protein
VVTQAIANRGRVNFAQVAGDVFGNLLGNALAGQIYEGREQQLAAREDARDAAMWQAVGGGAAPSQQSPVAARPPESYWRIMASSGAPVSDAAEGVPDLTVPSDSDIAASAGFDDGEIDAPTESSPFIDRSRTRAGPEAPERAKPPRVRVGETGPVISAEARTRGRLLFDAAINGTLGQVPLGPANDSSSVAITFPSTPGGAATFREQPRLAGDRVMTAPEYLFGVALPIVGAATAPVSFVAGLAVSALVDRAGLGGTWAGTAIEVGASMVDPKRAVQAMGVNAAKGVRAGEAGAFGSLNGLKGDGLTAHHMPQAAAGRTGYIEGGALVMTQAEHVATRTYGFKGVGTLQSDAGLSFRDVLARDIRDVRSIVGLKYNEGLRTLADYYRRNFPDLMGK